MALTRANVENVLIRRCGKKMTAAGLDGTTVLGSNLDLNDPIAEALLTMEQSIGNVASVSDADLAGVASEDYGQLFDLAELRVLKSIAGNLDVVDFSLGPRRESLSQLSAQVEQAITRLEKAIQVKYGIGLGTLNADIVSLDFMQKFEDE